MKGSAPPKKPPPESKPTNRRSRRLLIGLSGIVVAAAAVLAFILRPVTHTFYTDADKINEPAATARVRDILWQPPVRLPEFANSRADDYEPRLSADGMTLFFVRGKAGENADIYCCTQTPGGWTDPQPVVEVNTEYDDLGPEPSADGRALYFYSDRPGGVGGYDLWVVRRGLDGRTGFGEAANLGPLVNSEFNDYGPALTPDGTALYFASNRPRETDSDQPDPDAWPGTIREDLYHRTYDLYAAAIIDQGMGKARSIDTLNTPFNEGAPVVSSFGDFVYFASDRPGGEGGFDLYRARRLRGGLEPAVNLGITVNTAANELDPGLTMGGYALYFSSDRPAEQVDPDQPNRYQVYRTTSREVFTETETHRSTINWAAIWSQIGPNLLWALLAILLLLLLYALVRNMRSRKFSLLARCVLASLAVHLLLMLLFNVWEVTATLARELRGRGRIQIALVAPAKGDELIAQIRGEFTSVDRPATPALTVARRPSSVETESNPTIATLTVERGPLEAEQPIEVRRPAPDARVTRRSEVPSLDRTAVWDVTPPKLEVALPTELNRIRKPESTPPADPSAVRLSAIDRPPLSQSLPDLPEPAPQALLAPTQTATTKSAAIARSLVDVGLSREAVTPTASAAPPRPATTLVDLSPTLEVALPEVPRSHPETDEPSDLAARMSPRRFEPPGRARISNIAAVLDSPDLREVEPTRSTSTQYGPGSLVETDRLQAVEAKVASAALESPDLGDASVVRPPRVDLTLPALEGTTSAARPEGLAQPERAALTGVRRSLHELMESADAATVPSFEVSPVGRSHEDAPPQRLADSSPVGREATVRAPRPATLDSFQVAGPLPEDATLSLRLPREITPPDDPYAQRDRDHRLDVAAALGGGAETEEAVKLALRWLAAHQSRDGRWDGDGFDEGCGECGGETQIEVDVALTGLSVLCFLAADHTHLRESPYQENVARALQWLVRQQQRNGDLRGGETMYSQGIATIALAEAYGMTGDSSLREPVKRAVRFIERARNRRDGGWRYDPGQPGDTSVLGWQIMALKSAKLAGVNVLMESFLAARRWLDGVSSPSHPGRYAYQPGGATTPAMTAEGLFVQQILGRGPDEPRMRQSVAYLLDHLPDWENGLNTYFWYYATLALFHHQGEPWRLWNRALTEQLLTHQRRGGAAAGSWDPEGKWAAVGGRVYQTALCTLMLEVYYRYLPLFLQERPTEAIGTIRGAVTDVSTGEPLAGATVRLDLPDHALVEVISNEDGSYVLFPPEVPTFFALSASRDGYLPSSENVATAMVEGTTLTLDFALQQETAGAVAVEAVPDVHHLGDDRFDGRINSQFQKRSEGSRFTATFELTPDQLPPHYLTAELSMLVKGVQLSHRIRINGRQLARRLNRAPRDGSFGEFTVAIDPTLLKAGTNTLEIIARATSGDVDDFEFVNLQIRLSR